MMITQVYLKSTADKACFRPMHKRFGGVLRNPRIVVSAVLALLLVSSSSVADQRPVEGINCTRIDNDIARLECFDEVYSDYAEGIGAPGKWDINTTRDPIDDKITTYLAVEANEKPGLFNSFGSNQLIIRCMGDELDLYIKWGEVMGGEVPLNVTHRVGTNEAITQNWIASTSGNSTFYPESDRQLIQQMMESDRFVAQIPYRSIRSEKLTAIFDISGLKEAAAPIRQACLPPRPEMSEDPQERLIQELQQKLRNTLSIERSRHDKHL